MIFLLFSLSHMTFGRLMSDILDLNTLAVKPLASRPILEYSIPSPSVSLLLDTSPQSYVVKSLPGLSADAFSTAQWAGHIPIPYAGNDHYGDAFYWLLHPDLDSNSSFTVDTAPLIIWLNGGKI